MIDREGVERDSVEVRHSLPTTTMGIDIPSGGDFTR